MEELDGLMPRWRLAALVREVGGTQPTVSVDCPDFFRVLDEAIADTPIDVLRHYLRWRVVKTYASALPAAFEDASFAFYGTLLGGQQAPKPRWKRVLDLATQDIGELVSQLYVAEAFPPAAKDRCEHLVGHLLEAMGTAIRTNPWMTEATREEALRKLAGFTFKIGYPDEWRDYTTLTPGRDSFAANRMRAARFEHDRQFGRLEQPVDKGEWLLPPHIVNAYYHPLLNEIVFPAGHPPAAVLLGRRGRRDQLRRDRHGHRARDHPRVRRPGLAVRRHRCAAQLVDRGGPHRVHAPGGGARAAVQRVTR